MNHGLKVNGNVLEITIPDNIHIDKVIVNRQIFSQRQRVCESCKYHGLEGHEEPCVSCEVGNSNYVPSVGLEERTEECMETHACDCISRQAAIDAMDDFILDETTNMLGDSVREILEGLPSAEPERQWHPCTSPPEHHKDVLVRGVEAIGNVTVHKVMQWDVDRWRPENYTPSIIWKEWSEI